MGGGGRPAGHVVGLTDSWPAWAQPWLDPGRRLLDTSPMDRIPPQGMFANLVVAVMCLSIWSVCSVAWVAAAR